jgi:hypothetical protein
VQSLFLSLLFGRQVMDDLYVNLVVLAITGIVVMGIFLYSHRIQKKRSAALQKMADRHGWGYVPISEPLSWGTQITGNNWVVKAKSESTGQPSDSGSSNIQKTTVWITKWLTPTKFVLQIGPRLSSGNVFPGIFKSQISTRLVELDPGMAELSNRYLFLGGREADLDFLRESSIPRLLMEWPNEHRPYIEIDSESMKITISGYRMDKPEEFEELALLGEAFISKIEQ